MPHFAAFCPGWCREVTAAGGSLGSLPVLRGDTSRACVCGVGKGTDNVRGVTVGWLHSREDGVRKNSGFESLVPDPPRSFSLRPVKFFMIQKEQLVECFKYCNSSAHQKHNTREQMKRRWVGCLNQEAVTETHQTSKNWERTILLKKTIQNRTQQRKEHTWARAGAKQRQCQRCRARRGAA